MATANELWKGRTLSVNATERRHTRVFQSTNATSQIDALAATGVPAYGSVHPNDSVAYAYEYTVSNPNTINNYIVTVNYSTFPQRQIEQNITDPTQTPAEWNFDTVDLERVVRRDQQGNPTTNSAGDYYELVEVEPVHAITVTQILSSFNLGQQIDYENTVNTDGLWGFTARQLWIKKIRAPLLYRGSDVYFRRTIELFGRRKTDAPGPPAVVVDSGGAAVEPKPWDHIELDAGFNHLNDAGVLVKNTRNGAEFQTPQRLKADGSLANANDPDRFIVFRIKGEQVFDNLNMPASLPNGVTVA